MGSVVDVQMYRCSIRECEVQLSNSHWFVVNLSEMTCTCKWRHRWGLPCTYAMAVTYKQKPHVYGFVYPCCKMQAQMAVYMNVIYSLDTHNMATISDNVEGVCRW